MASKITQIAPSSSSSSWKYEVFLSFHGEDTRNGFTDHLRDALERNGIIVFRDDKEMNRGDHIGKELFKAIDESLYAVVIISENYAFSKWCLKELTKIMNCRKGGHMKVFPVFYNVDPSSVRNPMKGFKTAFDKHRESGVDEGQLNSGATAMEEVGNCTVDPSDIRVSARSKDVPELETEPHDTWRSTLTEAGYLAGWHVHNRSESIIIEEISRTVFEGLMRNLPEVPKFLVGMESPLKEMWRLLEIESVNVRFIGICGISGIGKTTLARVIYERISSQFDGRCFVPQIGEASGKEIVQCQKYLISEILTDTAANTLNDFGDVSEGIKVLGNRLRVKRVFIVLDDVCRKEQIEALAGSPKWFGNGSRIIITTRNRHLPPLGDNNIYDVEKLNRDDAFELFHYYAFIKRHAEPLLEREFHPPKELVGLIPEVVDCADGLPLALEVFGSYLDDRKDENLWKDYIGQLKADLREDISKKLEINLDGLNKEALKAFKDIACFFNGWYKDHVISKLRSLRYYPEPVLLDLERTCIIKFSEDRKLFMNDLIAKVGIRIAKPKRLCRINDIISVVKKNGVDKVKSIALTHHLTKKKVQLSYEDFLAMKNLKMLRICFNDNDEDCGLWKLMKLERDLVNFELSHKLRIMEWLRYPFNSLLVELNSMSMDLAELSLRFSHIKRLWVGSKDFCRLKHIDLSFSKSLIEIPNLNGVPSLEILDLSFCESLCTLINSSIEDLKELKKLLLQGCSRLGELPNRFSSESLEVLDLSKCSNIRRFPDISCSSPCLKKLDISGTAIEELPSLAVGFSSLEELSVMCCALSTTFQLPTLSALSSLEALRLCHCRISDEAIPLDLSGLSSLKDLDLSHNVFTKLSDSMSKLFNLRRLVLDGCTSLQSLPKLPLSLRSLHLRDCPLADMFGSQMTTQISRDMLRTSFSFSAVAYIGFDDKPHRILYLHPQSPPYRDDHEHWIEPRVVCGRLGESEIPVEFTQGSIGSNKKAEIQMDWKLGGDGPSAFALSIVYKATREGNNRTSNEPESSDMGAREDNNRNFPEFVCQLQLNETSTEQNPQLACQSQANEESPVSSIIRVPEMGNPGSPYRVWLFIIIPDSIREPKHKKRNSSDSSQESETMKRWSYSASVTASSENVELENCWARLFGGDATSSFSQLKSSICPGTLDEQSLDHALDVLRVTGRIGVVFESDGLNRCGEAESGRGNIKVESIPGNSEADRGPGNIEAKSVPGNIETVLGNGKVETAQDNGEAASAGQVTNPSGNVGTPSDERRTKGRASDQSPHVAPSQSTRDRKFQDNQKEESVESLDDKHSLLLSSPDTVRDARDLSVEPKDVEHDELVLADESPGMEQEEMTSNAIGENDSIKDGVLKKQKLSSRVEQPVLQEFDKGEDSKAARSSENSKARSGSSRDYKEWRDGAEEEVIQEGRSTRMETVKRHIDENEPGLRRKNRDGRQDIERNPITVKGTEEYPYRDWDPSSGLHPKKQLDNGSNRGRYDKDAVSRHRERDDGLKSRYDNVDDYHIKRRKDEDYLRRDHAEKEEILHGHRESSSRRKRERDEVLDPRKRDDVLDPRKRDGQLRVRDNLDDHHSVRHKDESWS